MKGIKKLLAGIGIMIFSIACFLITMISNWLLFDTVGIISVIVGIILIIMGLFDNE